MGLFFLTRLVTVLLSETKQVCVQHKTFQQIHSSGLHVVFECDHLESNMLGHTACEQVIANGFRIRRVWRADLLRAI